MSQENVSNVCCEMPFNDLMEKYRKELKEFGEKVKFAKLHSDCRQKDGDSAIDTGEMIANLTLSYRHIEDAIMRLGKAIQAHDGGISIYDKK